MRPCAPTPAGSGTIQYDGGALTIAGPFGGVAYKLNAGNLLLYPASSRFT